MPSLFRSAQVLPPAAWPHRCLLQEARVHRAGHAAGAPDRWHPHPFPHPGALHHQRHPPGHPHHHLRLFASTWGRCADHLWRSMWVHTLWFCPLCGWVMLFVLPRSMWVHTLWFCPLCGWVMLFVLARSMWVQTLWFCPLCGWVMLFVLAWEHFCQLISSEKEHDLKIRTQMIGDVKTACQAWEASGVQMKWDSFESGVPSRSKHLGFLERDFRWI